VLRIPQRSGPKFGDLAPFTLVGNCFVFNHVDWTLFRNNGVDAAQLAARRRSYSGSSDTLLCDFETPGHVLYLAPSVRDTLGEHALRLLADVIALPKPLWLTLHLWRNRIGAPAFMLTVGPSLRRDLEQLVDDLLALSCGRELDAARMLRVLRLLRKPDQLAPLRVSEAAGPLPVHMTYAYVLDDGANMFMTITTAESVAPNSNAPFFPELCAVVERLFLLPPEDNTPHGVRMPPDEVFLKMSVRLCDTCGFKRSILYYHASPSWNHYFRSMRRSLMAASCFACARIATLAASC
jgi:hypothetical protein